jgi:hypothetical protein
MIHSGGKTLFHASFLDGNIPDPNPSHSLILGEERSRPVSEDVMNTLPKVKQILLLNIVFLLGK